MKFLLIIIALAVLFNMIAKVLLPMFSVSTNMNQNMRRMQEKMNEMEEKLNKERAKSKKKNRDGDYIDYEEVK